jgi:pyruvate dehydrogenase (quinone)
MSRHIADDVLDRVAGRGVRPIYGSPGDGINGFVGAFDRLEEEPEVGCRIATSGPGGVRLLDVARRAAIDR